MQIEDLKGRFHAHITFLEALGVEVSTPPHGWKNTIILLEKGERKQTDVMVTRHFMLGSAKTPTVSSVMKILYATGTELKQQGREVTRVKLEHEDLPTLMPSIANYREAHVLVKMPKGWKFFMPVKGWVRSSNPMTQEAHCETFFFNKRFRRGTVEEIDHNIKAEVWAMMRLNKECTIVSTKIESTVYDSNQQLDQWWA